ncbi:L-serine dehydratase [Clostridium acidisoli DSM 12555]|jgi:L-serine dehydratase|uniref:L-serine deaminase n=1 Tax=Clostridium acidisoli DSM 12555 TaxID=1121291 RepID=A0A1W1XIX6_9CLOT|nr:L-serine ammonia-lyase, iron-sulfur-dependent subunit beta [Clostridium acidisoli]SMC23787.1 L-serine dehydratase [Clostridium acidisoli DSM 12555]
MREYSCFDILGPIMIGPSSSHTAGAARLAKIAAIIAGEDKFKKVEFYLHGSFAKTYRGHGTDKALVAGVLGLNPWDERLKNSFDIAKENNMEFRFIETDLGDEHPNTVKIIFTKDNGINVEVMGSSVGGGNIKITEIDGQKIEFTGNYPTLIIKHKDVPGMISKVSTIIYEAEINIAFLKVYRKNRGYKASMIFETDSVIPEDIATKIKALGNIESIRIINPIVEAD